MKFYQSGNNSVIALISEDHATLYGTVKKAGGDPIAAGCRVFTFCSKKRIESGVAERMTFTGTHEDMDRLMKAGNHTCNRGAGRTEWDGYVPFSNGVQYGYRVGDSIPDFMKNELRFVTTLTDVLEVFGIA